MACAEDIFEFPERDRRRANVYRQATVPIIERDNPAPFLPRKIEAAVTTPEAGTDRNSRTAPALVDPTDPKHQKHFGPFDYPVELMSLEGQDDFIGVLGKRAAQTTARMGDPRRHRHNGAKNGCQKEQHAGLSDIDRAWRTPERHRPPHFE